MKSIHVSESIGGNQKRKKWEILNNDLSEHGTKQHAHSLPKTGQNQCHHGRWEDRTGLFNAQKLTYSSTRVHRLLRAVSHLEIINIHAGSRNVLHRKLNLGLIENGVVLSEPLHWLIKIRFFSKIRGFNIPWVTARWIYMGGKCVFQRCIINLRDWKLISLTPKNAMQDLSWMTS